MNLKEFKKKQGNYYDFTPSWYFLMCHPVAFVAFGFGTGLSKIMPGTVGTIVGLPLAWIIMRYVSDPLYLGLIALAMFVVGIWICQVAEDLVMRPDYGGIVWDEIAAMALICFFIPQTIYAWISAYVIFRAFDIMKPWPIKYFDDNYHGGLGIMLDDLVAGVFSIPCVWFVVWASDKLLGY